MKNASTDARTRSRTARAKHPNKKGRMREDSEIRPTLAKELNAFQQVVRHIVRQDLDVTQAALFKAEAKQHFRRLKDLGVLGHQPAIAANCEVDPITTELIE